MLSSSGDGTDNFLSFELQGERVVKLEGKLGLGLIEVNIFYSMLNLLLFVLLLGRGNSRTQRGGDPGTALHSKGLSITVAHTMFNSPDTSNHPDFTFQPLADNLSEHGTSPGNLLALMKTINNCEALLRKCLTEMMKKHEPHDQILCIIYEMLVHYAGEAVANHMKIPKGLVPLKSVSKHYAEEIVEILFKERVEWASHDSHSSFEIRIQSTLLDIVPGLHPFTFKDLPLHNFELEGLLQIVSIVTNAKISSAIIWNTIDHIESSSLSQLQQYHQIPSFSEGPLHRMAPFPSPSLLKDDSNCIPWLNKQNPKSVIYCDSGWVELLPEGFKRGNQRGFWSHCGWNSTLESISEGIPVIYGPRLGDQYGDSKYLAYVWRVGLQVEHELERGEIEKAISG
ncbi:hypothetical protein LguiA_012101 [Lonicera macranthoides]